VRSSWRFALAYTAAWTPIAALYALGVSQRAPVRDAIMSGVSGIGAAALLGLVVRRLIPLVRDRARGFVAFALAHVGLAAAYSVLWTAAIAAMIRFGAPPGSWRNFVENAVWFQLVTGVALYGLVAGVFAALDAGERLRNQEAIAARAEALRVSAELRALRAQLNPHFLFNTLHSITALVRSDPSAAESALERFGLLMRQVLELNRQQRDEVSLGQELEFVRAYLALEAMRLGDRLRIVEEIEPDALECLVPTFSLQPLVENAVRHGIAPVPRSGTLRIAAYTTDDRLHLEVADDGAGADASRVAGDPGVGLQVVRQRLTARFGDGAHLNITTAPSEGFRVRIVTPIVLRAAPRPAPSSAAVR
jgi:anti-sigma regulatory factor (Ser/Thr protein kinase)